MPAWRLGTMGYGYPGWKGNFYPNDVPKASWLSWYAKSFNAVELNTTFHATPGVETVERWREAVPSDFRFSVKMTRQVTHELPVPQAVTPALEFVAAIRHLGASLGPVLLQFAPDLRADDFANVARLLEALPKDLRFAVEFRHASWNTGRTEELLWRLGMAYVGVDHEDHPSLRFVKRTADFLYVRLVGKHNRFPDESYERFDPTPALESWRDKIEEALAGANVEAWVLFNNDYAGHAPTTLRRFARLVGVELNEPARQQSLF